MTAVPLLDPSLQRSNRSSGTVNDALAAIARGEPVVVLDDAGRENEGDLILAAELVTPQTLAFVIRHTSGLVCVAMTGERLDHLDIPLMVGTNSAVLGTAFTVSVDHRASTTTGISAADRAGTIRALVDPSARPEDFARPGHVFPLRSHPGGVLQRPGHTEAAVDLARLAGLAPAGVLAEIVNPDGTMARPEDLSRFADDHGLLLITVDELVTHRRRHERLLQHVSRTALPTEFGPFTMHAFRSTLDGAEHVALVRGDLRRGGPILVHVHRECLTGDVLGSTRCRCGNELRSALQRIASEGEGIVVYVRGQDRDGTVAAQMLAELGVRTVRLLTGGRASGWDLADELMPWTV
ncbi:MAG: 3,4-dihydroxy-2-butanone-4-phosphate synthase [Actinomycetota bacterium]